MARTRMVDPGASFAACLGAALRRLRTTRGLTQAALGHLAGYHGSYIGALERAAVRPSRDLVERCDHALDAGGALLALWPLADQEWTTTPPLPLAVQEWTTTPPLPLAVQEWSTTPPFALALSPGHGELGCGSHGDPPRPDGTGPRPPAPHDGIGPGPPAPQGDPGPSPDAAVEAMELARRVELSEGAGAVELVERAVERLRRAAAGTPPGPLIPAVQAQRRYVGRLLECRLTLGQRRRLLAAAGWLSLLLARLHFDAGDREAAEANRDAARRLARQARHRELAAWAIEALAWWALVDGRDREALDLSRAGQDEAPAASAAAVQLALDEAQAWTSLGDQEAAAGARRQADLTRAMLPGYRPVARSPTAGAPGIARVD